jgi:hypothetical protein
MALFGTATAMHRRGQRKFAGALILPE